MTWLDVHHKSILNFEDLLVFPSCHNKQDAICLWDQREETVWHSKCLHKASDTEMGKQSWSNFTTVIFAMKFSVSELCVCAWAWNAWHGLGNDTFLDWPSVMMSMPPSNTLNTVVLPPSLVRVSTMQSPSEINCNNILKSRCQEIISRARKCQTQQGQSEWKPLLVHTQTKFDFELSVITPSTQSMMNPHLWSLWLCQWEYPLPEKLWSTSGFFLW